MTRWNVFFWPLFQYYLAVANTGGDRNKPYASIIYRWSVKRKRFRFHQELMTYTARDIEHFVIDGLHYLAVANHVQGINELTFDNHSIGKICHVSTE